MTKDHDTVLNRRSMLVLGGLVSAMTLTASLLMLVQPGPLPPINQISLSAIDVDHPRGTTDLFETAQPHAWQGIVIHDSGSLTGSVDTVSGSGPGSSGGLGYHFVITNGRGGADGRIDAGFRWVNQLPGDYATGKHAEAFNRMAIGICVVGDFDRQAPSQAQMNTLTVLVRRLSERFGIDATHVYTPPSDQNRGMMFPESAFRDALTR